jgi:hypothetical protein
MNTLVCSPLCPLYAQPDSHTPLVDELLCGWPVELLRPAGPEWFHIRTHYRYEGFAPARCLCLESSHSWQQRKKKLVLQHAADVLEQPDVRAYRMTTLFRGSLIAPDGLPNDAGWQKVFLPSGAIGYTKSNFLGTYYDSPHWDGLRQRIVTAAMAYRGVQYRWGGKSPLGLDCSGLVFMAYFLNGLLLYRDAKIVPGFPVRAIPLQEIAPADLLFFPGHVALYLGEGRYLHATARSGSDGVVINSLYPESADYREDLAHSITEAGSVFLSGVS